MDNQISNPTTNLVGVSAQPAELYVTSQSMTTFTKVIPRLLVIYFGISKAQIPYLPVSSHHSRHSRNVPSLINPHGDPRDGPHSLGVSEPLTKIGNLLQTSHG